MLYREGGGVRDFLSIRVQSRCPLDNSASESPLRLPRSRLGSRPLTRIVPVARRAFFAPGHRWGRARNEYVIWIIVQCV